MNTIITPKLGNTLAKIKSHLALTLIASISVFTAAKSYAQEDFSSAYKLYNNAVTAQNNTDTIKYAKVALTMGKAKFGAQSENVVNLKYNLALAYVADKQGEAAFDLFSNIQQDYRQLFGEYSFEHYGAVLEQIRTAKLRRDLNYKQKKRTYAKSVSYAVDLAASIAEREPDIAASVYYELVRVLNLAPHNHIFFDEAMTTNEKAEKLLLAKFGENDMRTLEVRFMYARFLQAKNKKNDAIDYFEKVIASVTSAIDTSHPYELASHASLVQLYEKKGQSDEATEHCIAIGRMTPWSDEIEPVPLYRIDPRYPEKMARKGDEGYAILEFTISSFGFVEDITIIESSHRDFEKTSLDALAKWRYAPKIEDGQAVESGRRKVKLDFTLG